VSADRELSVEIGAATEAINEFVRVFKVQRLYDPDHPQRREVETASTERIQSILDNYGSIRIGIEKESLLVHEEVVYHQPVGQESIAHLMFREGLRELVLHPGLTVEEMSTLVALVSESAMEVTQEQDLLARLWEQNFVHLRYSFVEQLLDEEWAPPSEEEEVDDSPVVLTDEDRQSAQGPPALTGYEPTLYFLDDEDLAILQAALEEEKERVLVAEGMTCIRELLLSPVGEDDVAILEALVALQDLFLEEGSWAEIMQLHELFVPYLESGDVEAAGVEVFAGMRRKASEAESLDRLGRHILEGRVEDGVAAAYYRRFAAESPSGFLAGLGDLKRICQRPVLAEAFREISRELREALQEALQSEDAQTRGTAAFLAGLTGDARLLEPLGEALESEDDETRREALSALKQFGGGRALEFVSHAIEDPDPGVRLYALRHLVAHRYAPAFGRVQVLLEKESGTERSVTESRLLYEAFGALGGAAVLDELSRRLRRRGGLFRKSDPEETARVLIALGAVGTPEARELVEQVVESKDAAVRRTAAEVLKSWGGPMVTST
jgi:hypothetical protein